MIIKTNPDEIQSFLDDTSAIRDGFSPRVYLPETEDEVRAVLAEHDQTGTRLTISGNGTGTTGGRIPFGDSVLATHKLNKILALTKKPDGTALMTVQCGVLLYDVQREAESENLFYPPDPTERFCFIGGTIANNSSGARTYRYGSTRDYIDRLKLALADGDTLDIRRGTHVADANGMICLHTERGRKIQFTIPNYAMPKTSKHIAGYFSKPNMDAIDLFIGSEGTLGVVLEADLRLIAKPQTLFSGLIYFADEKKLLEFVRAIRASADVSPRAVEFFDVHSLNFLRQKYGGTIPTAAVGAIFFEQETLPENDDALLSAWQTLMDTHHALSDASWIALTPDEQQRLRDFRHALPALVNEWYSKFKQRKISTDMAVPDAQFAELMQLYQTECQRNGFDYILFGHIGNSHLHLNILPKNAEEAAQAKKVYHGFMERVIAMGGTISAEHGVGKLKSEYLVMMFGEQGIREMVRIKKTFDDKLILNIGNLIPVPYL
jgi:D-lactate dehydrogenase (cytochrome)